MFDRAPTRTVVVLAVAVAGVSASGPIIATIAAPALAIAFWRNAMATGLLLPATLVRGPGWLRTVDRRQWLLTGAAGVFLAGHFAAWIPSLLLTSIASSTALVCTQPVWAALLAWLSGERIPARTWCGMLIALLGVIALTGADLALSGRALLGDLLALLGGVFGAFYVTIGAGVRRGLSAVTYTGVCYGSAAAVLFVMCVVTGQNLVGYDSGTWLRLVALMVFAQLLGHSMVNVALRTTSATVVSIVLLLEVPVATLIAAVWLGRPPPLGTVPALLLILAGIAAVTWERARDRGA